MKAATFFTPSGRTWARGPVLVRASLGRRGEERGPAATDDDLVALVRRELAATDRPVRCPEPLAARVNRWGGGLPQYGVGPLDRVAAARAALPPTLALAGAAYDGVGIAACVRSGQAAAARSGSAVG